MSINRQRKVFKIFFCFPSRLCEGKCKNIFSHFKYMCGQHNAYHEQRGALELRV